MPTALKPAEKERLQRAFTCLQRAVQADMLPCDLRSSAECFGYIQEGRGYFLCIGTRFNMRDTTHTRDSLERHLLDDITAALEERSGAAATVPLPNHNLCGQMARHMQAYLTTRMATLNSISKDRILFLRKIFGHFQLISQAACLMPALNSLFFILKTIDLVKAERIWTSPYDGRFAAGTSMDSTLTSIKRDASRTLLSMLTHYMGRPVQDDLHNYHMRVRDLITSMDAYGRQLVEAGYISAPSLGCLFVKPALRLMRPLPTMPLGIGAPPAASARVRVDEVSDDEGGSGGGESARLLGAPARSYGAADPVGVLFPVSLPAVAGEDMLVPVASGPFGVTEVPPHAPPSAALRYIGTDVLHLELRNWQDSDGSINFSKVSYIPAPEFGALSERDRNLIVQVALAHNRLVFDISPILLGVTNAALNLGTDPEVLRSYVAQLPRVCEFMGHTLSTLGAVLDPCGVRTSTMAAAAALSLSTSTVSSVATPPSVPPRSSGPLSWFAGMGSVAAVSPFPVRPPSVSGSVTAVSSTRLGSHRASPNVTRVTTLIAEISGRIRGLESDETRALLERMRTHMPLRVIHNALCFPACNTAILGVWGGENSMGQFATLVDLWQTTVVPIVAATLTVRSPQLNIPAFRAELTALFR